MNFKLYQIKFIFIIFIMSQNPFSMNGSELVAMIGKNCVGVATDTRLGNQLQTISTQTQKVFKM